MPNYTVGVHFPNSGKVYNYFTNLILEQGEHVIVDSSNGPGIAIVEQFPTNGTEGAKYASAWVLDRVDITGLRERVAMQEANME